MLWPSEGPWMLILDRPSILTLTFCERKDSLGRTTGHSPSLDFTISRFSGADHLLLRFITLWDVFSTSIEIITLLPNVKQSGLSFFIFLPNWIIFPFLWLSLWVELSTTFPAVWSAFKSVWLLFFTRSKVWSFFNSPFLMLLSVRDMQTSPTESLAQDSANSWVVRSGEQDDHPWPNTKNGYSTSTSTHTYREDTNKANMN